MRVKDNKNGCMNYHYMISWVDNGICAKETKGARIHWETDYSFFDIEYQFLVFAYTLKIKILTIFKKLLATNISTRGVRTMQVDKKNSLKIHDTYLKT